MEGKKHGSTEIQCIKLLHFCQLLKSLMAGVA
jgi:hypothetical protein